MRRRAFSASRHGSIEEPTVNLTPLVDVVFVVLIMFIVVAPLLELDEVALAHAPASSDHVHSVQGSSPIVIHVRKDNTIWLNQQQVKLVAITEFLKRTKMQHPTATPQLFHDKEAPFGTYQAIKNAAELAGFEQLDVILQPS